VKTDGYDAFHALVVRDPLFAAEGMDLARAGHGLDEIEKACAELEYEFSCNSLKRRLFLARYPLTKYVVPVAFLRDFICCERARRDYLAAPSAASARTLVGHWRRTVQRLLSSALRYKKLHDIFALLERVPDTYVFSDMFGNTSSLSYIHESVSSLIRNARAMEREIAYRAELLDRSVEELPAASAAAQHDSLEYRVPELAPELARVLALEEINGNPFRHVEVAEKLGPVALRLPHFDRANPNASFMLYLVRDRKSGLESAHLSLCSNFYFLKISDLADGAYNGISAENYRSLTDRGIPYWYQQATNLYSCREQRYWFDVSAMADAKRRPELDAALLRAQRSSMFDYLLGTCARHIRLNVNHAKRRRRLGREATYSYFSGLLTHSYPSVYYLTCNKSVWRLPEAPDFVGDGTAPDVSLAYRPAAEVLPRMTPGVLEQVMNGSRIREDFERGGAQ
jgi:hypothetical protein